MLKLSRRWVLILSGIGMLATGAMLLRKGLIYLSSTLTLLTSSIPQPVSAPLLKWMWPSLNRVFGLSSTTQAAFILLFVLSLILGTAKGVMVMKKVVQRSEAHIEARGGSVPLYALFPVKSLGIIGIMMGLGMSLNYFSIPLDIRGFIDMTIGFALIRGGSYYFRAAILSKHALQRS